jgi:hypothetical protein
MATNNSILSLKMDTFDNCFTNCFTVLCFFPQKKAKAILSVRVCEEEEKCPRSEIMVVLHRRRRGKGKKSLRQAECRRATRLEGEGEEISYAPKMRVLQLTSYQ